MIRLLFRAVWMLLGWIELIVFTLVMYALSFLPTDWLGSWYKKAFHFWSGTWAHALGVDLRLHHKHSAPVPDRFILVANHPSSFEDAGIPALFDVDSLAKHEVRDWFLVGRIGAIAGTIFVERDSRESRAAAAQQIRDHLAAGRSVALYPEGGIKGPRLQPAFRYGAFDISLQTGVRIVPVYLHYEALNDFHWGRHSLITNLRNIMMTSNNQVNYYLFDAIDPSRFDDKASYCEYVYSLYEDWQKRFLD